MLWSPQGGGYGLGCAPKRALDIVSGRWGSDNLSVTEEVDLGSGRELRALGTLGSGGQQEACQGHLL